MPSGLQLCMITFSPIPTTIKIFPQQDKSTSRWTVINTPRNVEGYSSSENDTCQSSSGCAGRGLHPILSDERVMSSIPFHSMDKLAKPVDIFGDDLEAVIG